MNVIFFIDLNGKTIRSRVIKASRGSHANRFIVTNRKDAKLKRLLVDDGFQLFITGKRSFSEIGPLQLRPVSLLPRGDPNRFGKR